MFVKSLRCAFHAALQLVSAFNVKSLLDCPKVRLLRAKQKIY